MRLRHPPRKQHEIDAVADRWLRRYTGPWQTKTRNLGPLTVEHRFRYRPRVEMLRFWIATQRAWNLAVRNDIRPLVRWIARRLSAG